MKSYYTWAMKRFALLLLLTACTTGSEIRGPATGSRRPAGEVVPTDLPVKYKVSNAKGLNPFAKVSAPTKGEARALGAYSAGCLAGGIPMPRSGPGYEMVRLSRNRYYAHPNLAAVLKRGGEALGAQSKLLYGDLSQPRGGPMPGGHASHQSGLDADVWFHKYPPRKKMTNREREHLYGQSMLRKDYLDLDPRKWNDIFATQLMWFAGQPETERIFVNAAVKRRLCAQYPNDPRLARLRPWFFHDDHFHLRLKCPLSEAGCFAQEPAAGIECEEKDLAGWFSKEIIAKFTTPSPAVPIEAELPGECADLVGAVAGARIE